MTKLRSRRLFKSSSKHGGGRRVSEGGAGGCGGSCIEWEMRPGGMLVQKRVSGDDKREGVIKVRVSIGSQWHDVSIGATSTFGELKKVLSSVTGLGTREQRLLFKGKERDDGDHLHMVGVRDSDKMLLLEDPATKEHKLRAVVGSQVMDSPCHTVIEV